MKLDEEVSLLEELERQKQEIQKKMEDIKARQKKPVMASMVESMVKFDIDPEELISLFQQRTGQVTTRRTTGKAPIKYRHPETGQAWTGRGKAPRWLTDEEAKGKSRDDFLVEEAKT